jgi:hypothetical protein
VLVDDGVETVSSPLFLEIVQLGAFPVQLGCFVCFKLSFEVEGVGQLLGNPT